MITRDCFIIKFYFIVLFLENAKLLFSKLSSLLLFKPYKSIVRTSKLILQHYFSPQNTS